MIREALPSLLLVALVQATQPAIANGMVPLCTQAGVVWISLDGSADSPNPGRPGDEAGNSCAHGWCQSRRPKPEKA
ncbi:hypothetical protein ACUJ46_02280 [Sandaracinobacteroides sp. A072]|uniref:hypothetical protein n=1 Tax=Sandaracinobacteroides sp. A072 TaxID=3461146 RepID=UPI004041F7C0